jgi:hypothetical protein
MFVNAFMISVCLKNNSITKNIDATENSPPEQFLTPQAQINELSSWKQNLGAIGEIIVSDSYAYVSGGDNNLGIIDISDLFKPKLVGWLDESANPTQDIKLYGDYIILSEGSYGIEIIDVSDKANPVVIYQQYHVYNIEETILYNQYLLVADMNQDLRIFDASDLSNLEQIAVTRDGIQGFSYAIDIKDHYVLVADGLEGLEIFDIQDIYNPIEISNYTLTNGSVFLDIIVENDLAYVLNNNGDILLFNISDITNPVLVEKYAGGSYNVFEVQNSIVYCFDYQYNAIVDVLNCSNPSNITLLSNYSLQGYLQDIFVENETIYLAETNSGITFLNGTDLTNITKTNHYGKFEFLEMKCVDDYAYLLDYYGYIMILNIANIYNTYEVGSYNLIDNTTGLFVHDDIIYVTTEKSGLRILNSTIKDNITEITSYLSGGFTTDVYVTENRAYITDDTLGLEIVDISDLSSLVQITTVSLQQNATSIEIHSEYAFVTSAYFYFYRVNINETSPDFTNLVTFDLGNGGFESIVIDNYCYVASSVLGIVEIIPEGIGYAEILIDIGLITDLTEINNRFLLAGAGRNFYYYDISYPPATSRMMSIRGNWTTCDVIYNNGLVYLLGADISFDFSINIFDSDTDGIYDYLEIDEYQTNPFDYDTDRDMLSDYEEIFTYLTSPLLYDTDQDGLDDGLEVLFYYTDPLLSDTDGDGFTDKEEIDANTDPLDPDDFPVDRLWLTYLIVLVGFIVISLFLLFRIRKNIKG